MTEAFAPFDANIYIGSGHSKSARCKNGAIPGYDKVRMRFETRRTAPLFLTVNVCTACGSIFLPCRKYDKHWVRLACYDFIRVKDGKTPFEERIKRGDVKPDPNYVPTKMDYHEIYKTPDYIIHGLRHPFCGGGMSPR